MGRSEDRPRGDRMDQDPSNGDNEEEAPPNRRERSRKSSSSRHNSSNTSKKKKRRLGSNARSSHHHHHHRHHHNHESNGDGQAGNGEISSSAEVAAATLLEHFRLILQGEGPQQPDIDVQKARNALEATAGNMQMAAQLYWDDYFASQAAVNAAAAQQNEEQQQPAEEKPPARSRKSESDSDEEEDQDDDALEAGRNPRRRLRRSLDQDFRAAHENGEESGADEEGSEGDRVQNDDTDDHDRQRQRQLLADMIAGQQARLRGEGGETVSVSDDEGGSGGVWRMVGNIVAKLDDDEQPRKSRRKQTNKVGARIREAAAAVASKVLPNIQDSPQERSRKSRRMGKEQEDDNVDYISDSDWLDVEGSTARSPFEILWGTPSEESSPPIEENESEGNVVADEDAEAQQSNQGSGIPHTWLNASFSLEACGSGLAIKPPKVEDIEFFAWRQQQNQGRSNASGVPLPYHCKAITAILSLVTGMIYTGSSIQGKEVNCTSAKTPFSELSQEEKKKQFEPRLADALSALLFIAARSSMERKKRALKKAMNQSKKDEIKLHEMRRKLNLIPTCSWEEDPSSAMPRLPDGPLFRRVKVTTSMTNIADIRIYVLSTLRSFTARGGVALFLENILRIHGKNVVARMMKRASSPRSKKIQLIGCTCEERQKKMYEANPLPASVRNDPTKLLDTTPPGTECVSTELLSLLMTGQVHSTWKGWSAEGLGLGLLSRNSEDIGWQLARPERPVWILHGETCFSVLWVEGGVEVDSKSVSRLDKPGTVMTLGHWNCWYGLRNKSSMRLITASCDWTLPAVTKKVSERAWNFRKPLEPRATTELLLERRTEKNKILASAKEHAANEAKTHDSMVLGEELDRVKPHPEDKLFYPDQHKMWRFQVDDQDNGENRSTPENSVVSSNLWVPYHRLTQRQKVVVELKLGPKINGIVWSRWPGATVDNFMPKDGPLPVV